MSSGMCSEKGGSTDLDDVAEGSGSDWVATPATTQADFVRETSAVFIGAMRKQREK